MKIKLAKKNRSKGKIGKRNRYNNFIMLFIFTIGLTLLSIVVNDLIIYPVAKFAIENSAIYTKIFINFLWITLVIILLFKLIQRVYKLKKGGMSFSHIIVNLISKQVLILPTFFLVIFMSIILLFLIYTLQLYNYYFLHRISNF